MPWYSIAGFVYNSRMYPLRFEPLFRNYIWGGRRLQTVLDKPIGEGDDFAESWEVVDHKDGQSVVAFGDLAGKTLHDLVTESGPELLGDHYPSSGFRSCSNFSMRIESCRSRSIRTMHGQRC